jgi:GDP-D-mannose 3', 5'-epimerase
MKIKSFGTKLYKYTNDGSKKYIGNISKKSINKRKTALVLGAGGFIGSHMVSRLKSEGFWVRGVDLKYPEFSKTKADDFIIGDLTNPLLVNEVMFLQDNYIEVGFDELYQFAADMGGAGFIFTGENDSDVMYNSAMINLNVANQSRVKNIKKLFYSSSACIYPEYNQLDPNNPNCEESSAYPANPDSEYGWEKLFSERLFKAFEKNNNLNVRIARFHNIFGIEGTWEGGREKAPAAMCRKAILSKNGEDLEVWGDGKQTRSFLYIDDCIEAVRRLMESDFKEPVNIGSEEMISMNEFAQMAIDISKKDISIYNIYGDDFMHKYGYPTPLGVKGRNSHNKLFKEKVGWEPNQKLIVGMTKTYEWIQKQVLAKNSTDI